MELRLDGKRAVVTGGVRGAGAAVVRALAAAGTDVLACYRRDDAAARRLEEELAGLGGKHAVVRADVTEPDQVRHLAARCRERFEAVDILVNCAGTFGRASVPDLEPAEWRRVIDTNLTGQFLVIRELLPQLADDASVVNVGAGGAWRGVPMSSHYTASKAAVVGLSRSLAKELGGRGIRVNTIEPGIFEDPGGQRLPRVLAERMRAGVALGRLTRPADIAGAVLFLASHELSGFVTGTTLTVDGGI